MGEGPLSQRRSAAHFLTDHILCLLCPASSCLGSLLRSPFRSLHAFALDTHLPHRNLFSSPFIHVCMHTHLVDIEKVGRWKVRVGVHLVLLPSLELSSPLTGHLSVCTTRVGSREGERMIFGASGYHLPWQTQGPPPETEPDRLFLLHFLSQDSFPWGIYPSFSSP